MKVFTRVVMGKVCSPRGGVLAGALQHTGLCSPPLPETLLGCCPIPLLHFEASTKDKN